MRKLSPRTWGVLTVAWAVITGAWWVISGLSLLFWCMVALTLFMAFMWWLRAREARQEPPGS